MTDTRRKILTAKFNARAIMGCVLGAMLLTADAPARAAEEEVPIDRKILRGILEGLGLRRDGEGITYDQRAPLVIPPGRALPPPENASAALEKNPAWPKDPDVVRRKVEAEQERNRNISDERERESRPLPQDQLAPGPGRKNQASRNDGYQASPYGSSDRMSPSELGYKGNLFGSMFGGKNEEETAKFTGEPPRSSLTAPPSGYQTPSPNQPYGAGKTQTKATTSADYLANHPAGEAH